MVTVVADRESDIYAEWATIPEQGFHLLSRAMVDRGLAGKPGHTLFTGGISAGGHRHDRDSGPSAGPGQTHRDRGNAVRRGGDLPPAR
jgi:hypothetical protein